jgi:hypothetical protein
MIRLMVLPIGVGLVLGYASQATGTAPIEEIPWLGMLR